MTQEEGGEAAAEKAAPAERPQPRHWLWVALPFALAFFLLVAGIGSSPYWAPPLMPLLPWAAKPQVSATRLAALAASLKALEEQTSRGLDALAAGAKASGENRAAIAALSAALARLEASVAALAAASGKTAPAPSAAAPPATAAVEALGQKLAGIESKWAEEAAAERAAIAKIEGELKRLDALTASLADRVPQLAERLRERQLTQASEAALFLGLLEMREAVDAGRPFGEAYAAFMARLRDRPARGLEPKLAAAAQALAPVAREGVPSLAALAQNLSALVPRIAAPAAPEGSGWTAFVLAHLRSLVRIRRTGKGAEPALERAIATAERDLARGDLEGAVAALQPSSEAGAADVKSWIAQAQKRLRAESTLKRLQELLLDSLDGGSPAAAPPPPSPGAAPGKTPGKIPEKTPGKTPGKPG